MKKFEELKQYSVEILDKRICDVEGGNNTETYREFIRESEKEFCLYLGNIDKCDDDTLTALINWLDDLWGK